MFDGPLRSFSKPSLRVGSENEVQSTAFQTKYKLLMCFSVQNFSAKCFLDFSAKCFLDFDFSLKETDKGVSPRSLTCRLPLFIAGLFRIASTTVCFLDFCVI